MTVSTQPGDLRELVHLVLEGAEANERPDLVRRMREAPAADAAETSVRALQSLEIDLRARRAALCDPGRGARLAAESRHAEARLRRFRDDAGAWQRLLGDALAATDSDLEYAVQSRIRSLLDEGTAVIESAGKHGDELDRWLDEHLVAEAAAGQQALRAAAGTVARRIATDLQLEPLTEVELDLEPPAELVGRLRWRTPSAPDRQPLPTRLLGILMPTYSGMMIAMVLPKFFNIHLRVWPAVIAAVVGALALGGAAFLGERHRQISRRNAESTGELRSAVDAFRMAAGKQIRDGVRVIDKRLHAAVGDAVSRRIARLAADADEARDKAQDSRRTEQAIKDVDADLASIRELRVRAMELGRAGQ